MTYGYKKGILHALIFIFYVSSVSVLPKHRLSSPILVGSSEEEFNPEDKTPSRKPFLIFLGQLPLVDNDYQDKYIED